MEHHQRWEEVNRIICSSVHSYTDWSTGRRREKCMEVFNDTFTSTDLDPVIHLNVTLQLKGGGSISKMVDLKKIGKTSACSSLSDDLTHIRVSQKTHNVQDRNWFFRVYQVHLNESKCDLKSNCWTEIQFDTSSKKPQKEAKSLLTFIFNVISAQFLLYSSSNNTNMLPSCCLFCSTRHVSGQPLNLQSWNPQTHVFWATVHQNSS